MGIEDLLNEFVPGSVDMGGSLQQPPQMPQAFGPQPDASTFNQMQPPTPNQLTYQPQSVPQPPDLQQNDTGMNLAQGPTPPPGYQPYQQPGKRPTFLSAFISRLAPALGYGLAHNIGGQQQAGDSGDGSGGQQSQQPQQGGTGAKAGGIVGGIAHALLPGINSRIQQAQSGNLDNALKGQQLAIGGPLALAQIQDLQAQSEQRKLMGQMVPVPLPDGTTAQVPAAHAQSVYGAIWRGNAQQGVAQTNAGARLGAAQIGAEGRLDVAGVNNASKENIAGASLAQKADQFKQSQNYLRWKTQLDNDTKVKVADLTQNKAPAAVMQTAIFANGGLTMIGEAQQAMAKLEASGVMGSLPANKVEDWIFGQGLVDPSLDANTRQEIGQLRASLGYTSSAAMRAHTGRTSHDIYSDFKARLGPNQDWSALKGAIDETKILLGDYSQAASNASISAVRQGNATPNDNSKPSGVTKFGEFVANKVKNAATTKR